MINTNLGTHVNIYLELRKKSQCYKFLKNQQIPEISQNLEKNHVLINFRILSEMDFLLFFFLAVHSWLGNSFLSRCRWEPNPIIILHVWWWEENPTSTSKPNFQLRTCPISFLLLPTYRQHGRHQGTHSSFSTTAGLTPSCCEPGQQHAFWKPSLCQHA